MYLQSATILPQLYLQRMLAQSTPLRLLTPTHRHCQLRNTSEQTRPNTNLHIIIQGLPLLETRPRGNK